MQMFKYIQSNHNWRNKRILHRCYQGDACSRSTRRAMAPSFGTKAIDPCLQSRSHYAFSASYADSCEGLKVSWRPLFFARQVCDIRAKELMKQRMQDFGDVCLSYDHVNAKTFVVATYLIFALRNAPKWCLLSGPWCFFLERVDLIFMTGNIFLAGIHQTKQACPYWQPNTRNMNKHVTQFQFGLQ